MPFGIQGCRVMSAPHRCQSRSIVTPIEIQAVEARVAGSGVAQRRNLPRPISAFSSPPSQTTTPREIVVSGQPVSCMPS